MLTLEEVSPTCTFWANKFKSKKFEFAELFNIAYLTAIKQKSVKLLQKRIRGELLTFIARRQKFTATCTSFESDNLKTGDENPLALCSKDKELQSIIESEELLKIIEEANISQSDEFLEIIRLIFVEGLSQTDIAARFNVTPQAISYRYNSIINSLITVNKRRIKCPK
jgi:RNA polymerase sigma factor (sigma-70 family)